MAAPSYRVSLNNNIIDGRKMSGGYSAWQLYPNGTRQAPVNTLNEDPYTVTDVNAFFLYGQDGGWDEYTPNHSANFANGETVTIEGPNSSPIGGANTIVMKGIKSSTVITWTFVASGTS